MNSTELVRKIPRHVTYVRRCEGDSKRGSSQRRQTSCFRIDGERRIDVLDAFRWNGRVGVVVTVCTSVDATMWLHHHPEERHFQVTDTPTNNTNLKTSFLLRSSSTSHVHAENTKKTRWPWPLTDDLEIQQTSRGCRDTCACKISWS